MNVKKSIALLLAVMMVLSLAACGSKSDDSSNDAPAIASSAVVTPFSASTYFAASSMSGVFIICSVITPASGSSPFSLAIVARVLRFGLYGRYKSSSRTIVSAERICAFSSSVSFPCSSMLASTVSLRSSSPLK